MKRSISSSFYLLFLKFKSETYNGILGERDKTNEKMVMETEHLNVREKTTI
jgi:hypothetical protein